MKRQSWIITGSFKVEDETGFIFIKTNAKSKKLIIFPTQRAIETI